MKPQVVISILMLLLLAVAVSGQTNQQPTAPSRVDTVVVVESVYVTDTLDAKYYELAEKAIEHSKSNLDTLVAILGLLIAVFGIGVPVVMYLMDRASRDTIAQSREVIRDSRADLERVRSELDRARDMAKSTEDLFKDVTLLAKRGVQPAEDAEKKEPDVTFEEKIRAISGEDAEMAVEEYEKLQFELKLKGLSVDDLPSSLRYDMGLHYVKLENWMKAAEEFAAYANAHPNDPEAFFNWGVVLGEMYNVTGNTSWLEQSFQKYERATEIKSDDHEAYNNWGVDLRKMFDSTRETKWLEQAFEKYKRATEIKQDFWEAFYNWGSALTRMYEATEEEGWLKHAMLKFQLATDIKTDLSYAFIDWGFALHKMYGKTNDPTWLKQAIEKYQRASVIEPNDADAWFNKSCANSLLQAKENMLESLGKAIFLDHKKRAEARRDEDFKAYWDDPEFIALTKEDSGDEDMDKSGGEESEKPS